MCTVTVIPLTSRRRAPPPSGRAVAEGPGVRLACNRDELRTRPAAFPPAVRRFGERSAILPVDPQSGGTWIAASDAGLAFSLLNVNAAPGLDRAELESRPSRGLIIPALLPSDTLEVAVDAASAIDAGRARPFRLVIADRRAWAALRCDGRTIAYEGAGMIERPVFFTTSGLGDQLVERPRRALFERMFAASGDHVAAQDQFHRHSWPDRPELSVCMRRADARTVSLTIIELRPEWASMSHVAGPPDETAACVTLCLPLRPVAA
ncbi:MAG: NRDE family protein [Phycisphaerae bacterium]|jgi:hypothetical protein